VPQGTPEAAGARRFDLTFDRLAIGLIFVAVAVLACFSPAQGDTWWHLRAGVDIWHTHSVRLVDTYSYTAAGTPFSDHGWLTDVLFAAFFKLGGLPLVEAACAAAIVVAWVLSWRLAEGPFETGLIALLAGASVSAISWALRPQVFSMAALMLTCTLVLSSRRWLLPFPFLVWANLHSAVLLGLVVLIAASLAEWIRDRRLPWALTVITTLCFVAVCGTPIGLQFWPEILASLARSRANALIEWQPPGWQPVLWPFWAMAAALPIVAVVRRRQLRGAAITLVFMALALLPLAARSVRNVPMFMLVAVPAITVLARTETPRSTRVLRERTSVNMAVLGLAAAGGIAIVTWAWITRTPVLGWQPLSGEAIRQLESCPGPLYNTFEGGGAIIWFVPQQKVFIDNRQDPYPDELLAAAHQLESDGRYERVFARYGIRCAIVPAASATSAALRLDKAWSSKYSDGQWAIFASQ
jgi:hypothetical protein